METPKEPQVLLKIYNTESTYHRFKHIALSYLMLKYSCGIHNIIFTPTINGLGELKVTSDGGLIFRAIVLEDYNKFATQVKFGIVFFKKHISDNVFMTLDEIKKMFIHDLNLIDN